jgi:hypothetical protein
LLGESGGSGGSGGSGESGVVRVVRVVSGESAESGMEDDGPNRGASIDGPNPENPYARADLFTFHRADFSHFHFLR